MKKYNIQNYIRYKKEIDKLSRKLENKEVGISPGQACVFYSKNKIGDKVLGGGWIDSNCL